MVVALLLLCESPQPTPVLAQSVPACAPTALISCPLPYNEEVTATLTSPLDVHSWHIQVIAPISLRVALTKLPADYGMRVFDPFGELVAERRRSGTGGEVVQIPRVEPGVYAVFVAVADPSITPSSERYSLQATVTDETPPVLDGAWQVLVGGTERGRDSEQLREPRGVVVGPDGAIYVVESSNHRVQQISPGGQTLALWGRRGPESGQFKNPVGLARDGEGFLYVGDRFNHRVQKLSPSGEAVAAWGSEGAEPGQFNAPVGVAVDGSGSVYVVDGQNRRIQKLSSSGDVLAVWGGPGSAPGQFGSETDGPVGIAVGPDGSVYIADAGNHRIQKLSPDGQVLAVWGAKGRDRGEFNFPTGVAVDPGGNVYVADAGNQRVQKLSPAGEPLAIWGSRGRGPGHFTNPQHLALDTQGRVYVTDAESHRLHRFTPAGLP
jgi:streptogramin lyase